MTDIEKEVQRRLRIEERKLALTRARDFADEAALLLRRAAKLLAADPADALALRYRAVAESVTKLMETTH